MSKPEKYLVDPMVVLAVLINPKTRELVEVRRRERMSVELANPGDDLAFSGKAYWDSSEQFEIDGDTYYRSHSPGADLEKGKGYGVVMYSGLALRAFSDTPGFGIASSDGGLGHSGRSVEADSFWERAVKNGLAGESTVSDDDEREYEWDNDNRNFDCDDVPDEDCREVMDTSGSIDITYQAGGDDIPAQYLPAQNVADKGLIFSEIGLRTELDDLGAPSADVLASLNLGNCNSVGLAEMVIENAISEGFDLQYVDRLVRTLPRAVYTRTSIYAELSKQLKFTFVANAARRGVQADVDRLWRATYGGLADMD